MEIFGGPIKGKAVPQHNAFKNDLLGKIDPSYAKMFPDAVCYTIHELRVFLDSAEAQLTKDGVPVNQQGIAIILGINDGSKSHCKDRVSTILVATSFTEDGPNGTVLSIDNPPCGHHENGKNLKSTVTDLAYDTGSMWP